MLLHPATAARLMVSHFVERRTYVQAAHAFHIVVAHMTYVFALVCHMLSMHPPYRPSFTDLA